MYTPRAVRPSPVSLLLFRRCEASVPLVHFCKLRLAGEPGPNGLVGYRHAIPRDVT